jgi:carbonic anhydrase
MCLPASCAALADNCYFGNMEIKEAHKSKSNQTDQVFLLIDTYQLALVQNPKWASKTAKDHPELFPKLALAQHPEILWIGCSDSRCPETAILGLQPGDVFVHRNIANIVQYNDLSSASVIEYAVVHLKVKHIVVCGHTACGGVAAALSNKKLGLLDTWLMPLRRMREQNLNVLNHLDPKDAGLKLAEINVRHGLRTLSENSVVIDAMQDRERGLRLHGAMYDVGTGILRVLDTEEPLDIISARLAAFKTEG